MLDHVLRQVPVRAALDAIPERFEIDVANLKIGHSIHIKDLGRPDLEYTLPLDSPIVAVLTPRKLTEEPTAAEAAAAAEAGPAEPEVITEKKPTEEEAEGEEGKGKSKGKAEAKGEKKEDKKEEKKDDKKKKDKK
jgi:large subunit ribosomal protein L25